MMMMMVTPVSTLERECDLPVERARRRLAEKCTMMTSTLQLRSLASRRPSKKQRKYHHRNKHNHNRTQYVMRHQRNVTPVSNWTNSSDRSAVLLSLLKWLGQLQVTTIARTVPQVQVVVTSTMIVMMIMMMMMMTMMTMVISVKLSKVEKERDIPVARVRRWLTKKRMMMMTSTFQL
jgi:hypothetical protein